MFDRFYDASTRNGSRLPILNRFIVAMKVSRRKDRDLILKTNPQWAAEVEASVIEALQTCLPLVDGVIVGDQMLQLRIWALSPTRVRDSVV